MAQTIYQKTFTRNFLLATVQIWWRAEVVDRKLWTTEQQPFYPYIVCDGREGAVSFYYNPRGIAWLKEKLIEKSRKEKDFFHYVEKNITTHFDAVKSVYKDEPILNLSALKYFLGVLQRAWVWFEVGWWLWEMTPEEKKRIKLPNQFLAIRENSQDLVPKSETVIRKSLNAIFPHVGHFVEVLSLEDITVGIQPSHRELAKRYEHYIFTDNTLFISEATLKTFATKYDIMFEEIVVPDQVSEINGETAYKGKVLGTVRVLLNPKEMSKVLDGDILVSPMTLPDVLPAMKRASAFVTDEGGIMCHAAIIAREMRKPCIIGTKIATRVLKDGDMVEVDAEKGIVKIIKRA